MVISSEAVLQNIIVHKIEDDNLLLSNECNRLNGGLAKPLVKFIFKPFFKEERFHCANQSSTSFFQNATTIFDDSSSFVAQSQEMAKRLFQLMGDDKTDGDLLFCFFEDCVLDDEVTDVVAAFFFDRKQQFLKVAPDGHNWQIGFGQGQSKILKGILLFNTDVENGYQSLVINKGKGSEEDPVWSAFLGTAKIKDNYFQTQHLIHNIQEFAQQNFESDESSEKIALINESLDFIKENDFFEKETYQDKVLMSPELIGKFNSFHADKAAEEPELQNDHFEISKPAVKKSKRFIRSVIKLDKNFHVYVHGNKENIIKGFDEEKKKHFYTLYYEEEN